MESTISGSTGYSGMLLLKKILLVCGILSSVLYVAMNIFIPMEWSSYSSFSQTVSELSAIGAPTRPLWVPLGVAYAILAIVFGGGVWMSGHNNHKLSIVGILLVIYRILSLAWPPMHLREALAAGEKSLTDTMHIVFTVATVLLMVLEICFGAAALGKVFRLYSIATLLTLLFFGILTSLLAPKVQANLPTPWAGVWERINIGVYLLWVVVLAIILLRKEKAN